MVITSSQNAGNDQTQNTNKPVKEIVILGGGSAGWITACLIAADHQHSDIQITLLESKRIGTIGVGEGTWPTMRQTLKRIGISETEFLVRCNGSFKQGSCFNQWRTGKFNDRYYHPFSAPLHTQFQNQGSQFNLAELWQGAKCKNLESFTDFFDLQNHICELGLGPKSITTPEYQGVLNYGYHLDAGKFAELLYEHGTQKLGIQHVEGEFQQGELDRHNNIVSLKLVNGDSIKGDFFIDCTGFSAKLISGLYQVPFNSVTNSLFIDTALAVQIPYSSENSKVATATHSTAQSSGWIWDIGLTHRRGTGYVYSSSHTTEQQAAKELAEYLNLPEVDYRKIPIRSGHRNEFWKHNCVAVGLSAGFLEPLEASALMLIELSAQTISDRLPRIMGDMEFLASQFNRSFSYRWNQIIDFLKLHYALSDRNGEQDPNGFWEDNRNSNTWSDSLKNNLILWQHYSPSPLDFNHQSEVFSWASYQYVLYGMKFVTEPRQASEDGLKRLDQLLSHKHGKLNQLKGQLIEHRQLLEKIHQYGLPKQ